MAQFKVICNVMGARYSSRTFFTSSEARAYKRIMDESLLNDSSRIVVMERSAFSTQDGSIHTIMNKPRRARIKKELFNY